ncbi:hypothetical protein Ancab_038703 [Ancistrocladus abbreviatus]
MLGFRCFSLAWKSVCNCLRAAGGAASWPSLAGKGWSAVGLPCLSSISPVELLLESLCSLADSLVVEGFGQLQEYRPNTAFGDRHMLVFLLGRLAAFIAFRFCPVLT